MTAAPDTWTITTAEDAARARILAARLTADAEAPAPERARFLIALTAQLRRCLRHGGAEFVLTTRPAIAGAQGHVRVAIRPADAPLQSPPWQLTLTAPRPPHGAPPWADVDVSELAEAVLAADEDSASRLEHLERKDRLVRFHREELHETNQGVLALHAELEAAALAQQDLLGAERTARAEAENARRLLTFLADASAAVTASLDHEDILRRLPGLLVPDYAADVDVWLFDEGHMSRGGGRPAAAVTAARTGRPQHAAAHPGHLPGIDDLPPSALAPTQPLLCIPLTAHRMLGVLTLTAPAPGFDPDTSVMLVEFARRMAIALDNAHRYEQNRDIAEALQRAQLTELPRVDGLALAARYLPATLGMNIGGDWYDAFAQPDGSVLAVIGDVTGHGLRAAIMMGQLRTALRAYAVEGDGPGRILTRLHHMLHHQQPDLYATALIARFRPGDPTLVWAAAGHLPAVVRAPDGAVRVLDAKPGVMLGVPIAHEFEDHTVDLLPGSVLALFTDGLVERRAQGIDPGIERLSDALSALSTAQLDHDLDASAESLLLPMLHDSERDDDVCLLLCLTSPVRAAHPLAHDRRREPYAHAAAFPAGPDRPVVRAQPTGRGPGLDSVEIMGGEGGLRDCL